MQNLSVSVAVVSGQRFLSCFHSFLIFSTLWCPFNFGLVSGTSVCGGLNSVLRDCGHNYHDRPLHRVINKAVMMYFDPSTADILAGAHSIEFPAYHYYVATSPPATSPAHENFTVAIFSARPAGTMPPLRRAGAGGYLVKISEKIPGYSPAPRHTPTEQCVASPCDMAVTNSNKQTKL